MTPEMFSKAKLSIAKHEGFRQYPYFDTTGNITIGYGYNLSARGLDKDFLTSLRDEDIEYFYYQISTTFPWFKFLNDDRKTVLIDMAFMGWKHFMSFSSMFDAIAKEDYELASQEILSSKWAIQVGDRAHDLATGMRTGVYKI
jgi:lysozyme